MRNAPHGYELIDPYYRHLNKTLNKIEKNEGIVDQTSRKVTNQDKEIFQDLLTKHITLDQKLSDEELGQLEEIVASNDSQVLKKLLNQVKQWSLGAH